MSKMEKRAAVWAATQVIDRAINREAQREGLGWLQIELLKLGAAWLIAEML